MINISMYHVQAKFSLSKRLELLMKGHFIQKSNANSELYFGIYTNQSFLASYKLEIGTFVLYNKFSQDFIVSDNTSRFIESILGYDQVRVDVITLTEVTWYDELLNKGEGILCWVGDSRKVCDAKTKVRVVSEYVGGSEPFKTVDNVITYWKYATPVLPKDLSIETNSIKVAR